MRKETLEKVKELKKYFEDLRIDFENSLNAYYEVQLHINKIDQILVKENIFLGEAYDNITLTIIRKIINDNINTKRFLKGLNDLIFKTYSVEEDYFKEYYEGLKILNRSFRSMIEKVTIKEEFIYYHKQLLEQIDSIVELKQVRGDI